MLEERKKKSLINKSTNTFQGNFLGNNFMQQCLFSITNFANEIHKNKKIFVIIQLL